MPARSRVPDPHAALPRDDSVAMAEPVVDEPRTVVRMDRVDPAVAGGHVERLPGVVLPASEGRGHGAGRVGGPDQGRGRFGERSIPRLRAAKLPFDGTQIGVISGFRVCVLTRCLRVVVASERVATAGTFARHDRTV